MSDDLLTRGLELFAAGDFAGAAQAWVQARLSASDDPQVEAYISHLRQLAPDVVAAAEASVPDVGPFSVVAPAAAAPAIALPATEDAAPASAPAAITLPASEAGAAPAATPAVTPPTKGAEAPTSIAGPSAADTHPAQGNGREATGGAPVAENLAAIEVSAANMVSGAARPPGATEPPPRKVSAPQVPAPPAPAAVALAPIEIPVPVPPVAPPVLGKAAATAEPPVVTSDEHGAAPEAAGPWHGDSVLGPTIEVSSAARGLDLVVAPAAASATVELPRAEIAADEQKLKELLELDDFSGALDLAKRILSTNPDDVGARQAKDRCQETLEQMYCSKIGNVAAIPKVIVSPEEVIWLDLDHRSGFLLAQVDGQSSVEEIIELSGMERLESLRIMAGLIQKGVIGVD